MTERIGKLRNISNFYETQPQGFISSNVFINAAAIFETSLSSHEILNITEQIERDLGRTSKSNNNQYHDRIIDIDLLALSNEIINSNTLILPHPSIAKRRFVLEPLCEIASDVLHPVLHTTYGQLLQKLNLLHIVPAKTASENFVTALNTLLPSLTKKSITYTIALLSALLENKNTHLFFGSDENGDICATYTLCTANSPTGCKAWLEDVIVSPSCRHRGYGKQLINHAIYTARTLQAKSLNLTSRPERQAANSLYKNYGFKQRNTNVYRLEL